MTRSVLLALCSLALFVGLMEGATRLVAPDVSLPADPDRFRFDAHNQLGVPYHERDAFLGWRLSRNARVRISPEAGDGGVMRMNAEGFRGDDFAFDKPPGTFRILFVGDSNTMGYPLGDDRAPYPAQTERLLADAFAGHGIRFESINLGVDGYTSFQARRVLALYLDRLRPDAVVVQVGFNDHTKAARSDASHGFRRSRVLNAFEHSHAYRLMRRWVLTALPRSDGGGTPVPRVDTGAYGENLRAMCEACKAAGADVLFVTTAARPTSPLVINERNFGSTDAPRWMAPDRWVTGAVEAAGLSLDALENPDLKRLLRDLVTERPDNPVPYYHLERIARAAGDSAAARTAAAAWRARDEERAVLGAYMDVLRGVGASCGAGVVEGGRALGAYASTHRDVEVGDFFVDFVHLDARGHSLVAQAVGRALADRAIRAGRVPSPVTRPEVPAVSGP